MSVVGGSSTGDSQSSPEARSQRSSRSRTAAGGSSTDASQSSPEVTSKRSSRPQTVASASEPSPDSCTSTVNITIALDQGRVSRSGRYQPTVSFKQTKKTGAVPHELLVKKWSGTDGAAGLQADDVVLSVNCVCLASLGTATDLKAYVNNAMQKSQLVNFVVQRKSQGPPSSNQSLYKGDHVPQSEGEETYMPALGLASVIKAADPKEATKEATHVSLDEATPEVTELVGKIKTCAVTELRRWATTGIITGLTQWRAADKLVVLGTKEAFATPKGSKNYDAPKKNALQMALHGLQSWLQGIEFTDDQGSTWAQCTTRLANMLDKGKVRLHSGPCPSAKALFVAYQKAIHSLVPTLPADVTILEAIDEMGFDWSNRCTFSKGYSGFPIAGVVLPENKQGPARITITNYALLTGFLKALDCSRLTSSFVQYKFKYKQNLDTAESSTEVCNEVYWAAHLDPRPEKAGLYMLACKFAEARPCILYPLVHTAIKADINWRNVAESALSRMVSR